MKYSMLENGLDFLVTGINHLQEAEKENISEKDKARELKYSLLHLSSGMELVFKSRLNIEHWTYIFDDMNNASKKRYMDGSLKTVDSNTAIKRLESLCSYSFDKNQEDAIRKLRDARNRFEHGFIASNPRAIEAIINGAIEVIIDFLGKNFDEFELPTNFTDENSGLTDSEKEYYTIIIRETKKLKSHHDDAVKLALTRALNITLKDDLMECPECGEKLLRHSDGDGKCYCFFCEYSEDSQEVAKNYIEKILNISEYEVGHHGGEFPLYTCPDCACDSMIKTDDYYFCFNCGMKYKKNELRECEQCGNIFYPYEDEEIICKECLDNISNSND